MGKAIPYIVREKMVKMRTKGHSYKEIVEELGYSEEGVRKVWYRYNKKGKESFKTNYHNCGGTSPYGIGIQDDIKEIRDNLQGGAYVRSKLEKRNPGKKIPHERTLQRWWSKTGENRKTGRPKDKEKKVGARSVMKHGK